MKQTIGTLGIAALLCIGLANAQEDAQAFEDTSMEAVGEAPAEESYNYSGGASDEATPAEDSFAESAPAESAPADSYNYGESASTEAAAPEVSSGYDYGASAPVETYAAPADDYGSSTSSMDAAATEPAEPVSEPKHYLAIMGTGTDADSGRSELSGANIDYGAGFSVLYGWQSADNWGFEVQGFSETFETDTTLRTDFYRYGLNLDLFYAFGDRVGFTPFVLIGVGGNYNDVFPQEDDLTYFANAGVGFVTAPVIKTGNIRIRGEARYIYDDFESGYGDIRYALGIEIPLFAEREVAVAPVVEQVQVVQVVGLKDSDGDGVVDEKDQCPDTPTGERVDGNGCPLGKVIALNGVTFEFNKVRLRPDAQTILDLATDILKKYPDMEVEVAGHTDNIGSDAYNQKLSEGRATSVRDYFVEKGVTNTLTVKGYGEAEPVTENDTEEGRERNRRVELRILN